MRLKKIIVTGIAAAAVLAIHCSCGRIGDSRLRVFFDRRGFICGRNSPLRGDR